MLVISLSEVSKASSTAEVFTLTETFFRYSVRRPDEFARYTVPERSSYYCLRRVSKKKCTPVLERELTNNFARCSVVYQGFPEYLQINADAALYNPSNLTVIVSLVCRLQSPLRILTN